MAKVINIRGMNGSGKTWLMQNAFDWTASENMDLSYDPYVQKYVVGTVVNQGNAIVLGKKYEAANCAGCDEFSWKGAHDYIQAAVMTAADLFPIVAFEGIMVSSVRDRYIRLAEALAEDGHETHWVVLTPDLEDCLDRIHKRSGRVVTENMRSNTKGKMDTVHRHLKFVDALPDDHPVKKNIRVFNHSDDALVHLKGLLNGMA